MSCWDPARACTRCPRLVQGLAAMRSSHPDYFAAPVPGFGDLSARVLVVGLAPGMHGANRTGRPFTGDYAGLLLYATLFAHGFSNQPNGAELDDGLELRACRIVNAVRCLPPQNKPLPAEIHACNDHLRAELEHLPQLKAVVALGRIAHEATLRALALRPSSYPFGHGLEYLVGGGVPHRPLHLLASYHCSRYNTQTRRLTPGQFNAIMGRARELGEGG